MLQECSRAERGDYAMDLMQAIVMWRAVREYDDMPVERARIEDHACRAKLWLLRIPRSPL